MNVSLFVEKDHLYLFKTASILNHHSPYALLHTDLAQLEISLHNTESSVMALLDGAHTQYDPAHALLLCHSFAFEKGQRFLLERQQSTGEFVFITCTFFRY